MTSLRILLVDLDAPPECDVATALGSGGYDIEVVSPGAPLFATLRSRPPSVVILNLDLPDVDSAVTCSRVRQESKAGLVALSCRGSEADKVAVLDRGADDYITRPFGPAEFAARIRAVIRRVSSDRQGTNGQLNVGDLTIDYDRHRVLRRDEEIHLTPKEFDLLALLARNSNRILTHRSILETIWGPKAVSKPEYLWTLVSFLRKKLEPDPTKRQYLISEPSIGYGLATDTVTFPEG